MSISISNPIHVIIWVILLAVTITFFIIRKELRDWKNIAQRREMDELRFCPLIANPNNIQITTSIGNHHHKRVHLCMPDGGSITVPFVRYTFKDQNVLTFENNDFLVVVNILNKSICLMEQKTRSIIDFKPCPSC